MGSGIVLGTGLILLAAILQIVATLVARGALDRNGAIGIRTRATRASDHAWTVGHAAARPWLLAAAVCGYGTGVLTIVAAVADAGGGAPAVPLVIGLGGYVVVIVSLVFASIKADGAARMRAASS